MPIDRIGSARPPPKPAPDALAPNAKVAGQGFPPPERTGAAQANPVAAPSSPLERLRAGEINVDGYVDLKVDEATSHLGALPPAELRAIRSSLRERLVSDPSLLDLVRTATGETPQPRED